MPPNDELTALKRKRGALKSRLTCFTNFINGVDKVAISERVLYEIQQRFNKNQLLLNDFESIQDQIDVLCDEPETEYTEREQFEKSYYDVISRAVELIPDSHPNQPVISRLSSSMSNNSILTPNVNTSQLPSTGLNVKLPTIVLPKFGGKYDGWLEFRDIFRSLIHTNGAISDMQRYHYLRASLESDAAEVIKSLEFCENNYVAAWQLLCRRYDNSPMLVHNHVKAIFGLEPVKRESAHRIRTLVDSLNKHISALSSLGQSVSSWDVLIIHIISEKLDNVTMREWEESKDADKLTSLDDMLLFLRRRADVLELLESKGTIRQAETNQHHVKPFNRHFHGKPIVSRTLKANVNPGSPSCTYCHGEHFVSGCESLIQIPIGTRMTTVMDARLCINCLRPGHSASYCRSPFSCKNCGLRHHSLLHMENSSTHTNVTSKTMNVNSSMQAPTTVAANCSVRSSFTLLPTALVFVQDQFGNKHTARVLLDSGSQANFITAALARRLNLQHIETNVSVIGISQNHSQINHECSVIIQSRLTSYRIASTCLVTPKITGTVAPGTIRNNNFVLPPNLKLADPEFLHANEIDLLIGSSSFWHLLSVGQHKLEKSGIIMQKTRLGWIVSGNLQTSHTSNGITSCNMAKCAEIHETLIKFWKLEDCNDIAPAADTYCETHFQNTHTRNANGRFVVSIPFKDSIKTLGDSYEHAKRRFLSLERRLNQNIELKQKYFDFMNEYIALGHMSQSNEDSQATTYYLPHHCVFNNSSLTTKFRVVFDGSATATCGTSINTHQYVGPTIQDDLFNILLRFRVYKYVVTADISKMYRQVLINEHQRPLQRILWRPNSSNNTIESFDLNTVTYGTAAASFLAIRCLEELARNTDGSQPNVAYHIRKSFYVDDLIAGFHSINDAVRVCSELTKVLSGGCFPLRKWASNSDEILTHLTNTITGNQNSIDIHTFDSSNNSKTLGLQWCRSTDCLSYVIPATKSKRITKRTILSQIASIFDPLGLVGPCTIIAKIIIQELWREKLTWDESLPALLSSRWFKFRNSLELLTSIRIPRLSLSSNQHVYLHGFCDASQSAYGACIYLVCEDDGISYSHLLCAKSRVCPLKTETIPRLELCAAVLLAKLLSIVRSAIELSIESYTLWSDSVVVLCWIRSDPRTLKTFVSNRVQTIKDHTNEATWRHVPTISNPADLLSRGVDPSKLHYADIWWHGPSWLTTPTQWPFDISRGPEVSNADAEAHVQSYAATSSVFTDIFQIKNTSSLRTLTRKCAYVLRFIANIRNSNIHSRNRGLLSLDEINEALNVLIKGEQQRIFVEDIKLLKHGSISKNSRLIALNPFLDTDGMLRVGGRLRNSNFSHMKKHPIILPSKNHLTELIFKSEHVNLFHAGPQALLSAIRERFWPLLGRGVARKTVKGCITCKRLKPEFSQPLMGDLPGPRVTSGFPFINCGIDFAGPFLLKTFSGRGAKTYKSYIALFVCLSTRALHLDVVTGLDTPSFIACLRRFVARRGKPAHVYTDNGTNFKGANKELKELRAYLIKNAADLSEAAVDEGIRWHFIPAYSPNFGGLWEAGVKSTKHHLLRVIGDRSLTYEDFSTLIYQIEAILNSRPISPLSSDPNDLSPLTPAHLLIGRTFNDVPDDVGRLLGVPENRLDRYQKIQALVHGFWKRWSTDYINTLQQRSKWRTHKGPKLIAGDIVILQEPNQPPLHWRMGRIITLHQGPDGISRVATVKTSQGILSRAISKLCPLVAAGDTEMVGKN